MLGWFLDGATIPLSDDHGHPVLDDRLLIWFNPTADQMKVQLPPDPVPGWRLLLDSAAASGAETGHDDATEPLSPGADHHLEPWSVQVLLSPVATN